MPDYLQELFGYVNDVSSFISGVLAPFINLIFAVSALVIVVGCFWAAYEHLMSLRKDRDVLAAIGLGSDVIVASVFLSLIGASNPLNVLYLVATAAVAVGLRLGAAKLSR